ncbi:hypothetical protein [Methanocella sp. MCL-LM]|uniref:hypothetical protein n=1 Tax=Methanocella sp. MCL-LM TaxID=3412035 RepID=UPI003C78707E
MRRWRGNGRLLEAASLRACEGGWTGAAEGAARSYLRGASPTPTAEHPKNRSRPTFRSDVDSLLLEL